jgi:hypothetical protein
MEEIREIIREIIKETIRKVDGKHVVYPKRGGKRLGTHSTKTAAEKQLQTIHIQQHSEMLNYPNWLRNTAQTPQNNPDGEHRFYLPKKKKIKEFAMGMMSPAEKAKHQRNMHRLMKILNKNQVHYFPYPNIPNTLVRKLYEASYKGNLGFEEIIKFYQSASKQQIEALENFLSADKVKEAWRLVQQVLKTKLVGKEFNETR